ncbi:hypothetical protein GCM10027440_31420 [Nocardiopsis coralliicola]
MTTVPPPTGMSPVSAITVPITASCGPGTSSSRPQPAAPIPTAPATPIARRRLTPHPHVAPAVMRGSSRSEYYVL